MKKDLLNVKLLMILNLISFSLLKSISLYAASESTQSFSLSGTLYQSGTTTPLHDPNVVMLIQIINPDKTCLLYEEQQVISVGSNGFFNVTVGSMTGSSKRTSRDPNQSMATIFQNTGMIFANNLQNASCIGGLYMPSATDTRYIRVTITPSSTGVPDQMTPDIALNSTPSAIVAQSVQGLERNSILQKKESSSIYLNQTNLEWLFNSGNYTKLQKLLAGELVASQNNGVSLPKSSTDPSSATEGAIWYDSVNKVIKFYDGTSSLPLGAAGSGFTTLTVGSDMTANGTAGGTLVVPGGTIDLKNSGVTAGTYTKFTVNTKGLVSSGSTLVESDIPTLSSAGKVSGSAITSGQISGSTSINTTGNITTTGTVTSNNISTNAVYSPSINGGSNASSNLTLDSTAHATKGNIILAPSGGGKVGIGTSTPGATLDVKGEIRMSGATSGYTGFKPAATAGSTIWTLPAVDGANGQVLTTNGSATLTWSTPSGSGISSLNGLTGGTQTYAIGTTGTSANWDSTGTVHTLNIPVSSTASVTAGLLSNADYITFSNKLSASTTFSGDVSGAYNSTSVDKIKGVAVSATAPSAAGQLLRYDGASSYVPAFISLADVRSTVTPTNTMFPSSSCSSSQTLTWSSLTDTMSCTNITGFVTSVATGTGLSGGTITSTGTINLADTAVTAGSYGSSTSVSTFTVDAQGRLTAASSAAIPTANTTTTGLLSNTDWNTFNGKLGTATSFSGDVSGAYNSTSVDKIKGVAVSATGPSTGGEFLVYNGTTQYAPVAISGDATMSSTGALTLKNTGTAGTYGSATQTPVLTTDAQGRVTGVTNTTITPAWSSISSKPTTLTGYGITDAILNAGGTPSIESGVLASRPAFGNAGNLYVSTDNNTIYRDTGSAWVAIGDGAGTGTVTSVATGTGLSGGTITSTGTISLADTAVTAGSYGSSTSVSTFTVDAQGRLTAASSAAIPTANTTTTGLLSNTDWNTFNSKQATGNYITALTGDVTGSGPGSTSTTIANDAITTAKILNGAVSTDKMADSSVTTIKLADNSVTTTKALSANPGINRLIMTDGTTGANLVAKSCSLGEILNWTATGWDCTSISGGSGDFKADGSVPMTGTLKMGGNTIYGNSTSGGN